MPKVNPETLNRSKDRVLITLRQRPLGWTEAELAEELNVNRRTLHNWLWALQAEWKVEKDGIYWFAVSRKPVQLSKFDLSPEEAMTLYLAARLLTKQQDKRNEAAETALMKLADVLTADVGVGQEIRQAAQELAHRPANDDYHKVFRTLMQSYIYRRVVHIHYEPAEGNPFETDFSPYLLEPSAIGFTTYAIGYSSLVNARRTYKLERIRQASLTRQEYQIPPDFPGLDILKSAWSIIYGEKVEPVTLRFGPAVYKRIWETRWHPSEDKKNDPDKPEHVLWTAQIADTTDMLPWIRGWGADCEVLAPEGLKQKMKAESRRLARMYGVSLSESPSPYQRILRCWGKTGKTVDDFHPAMFHMLDVGHVAQALLGDTASPRWRYVLAQALDADADSLMDWVPYLIALHDIGKVSAAFQGKNDLQKKRLTSEQFDFGKWVWREDLPHNFISALFVANGSDQLALSESLRGAWQDALDGHHGFFRGPSLLNVTRDRLRVEPAEWSELRAQAVNVLKVHLLQREPPSWPRPHNISAAAMALAGFTILCDWLGSDKKHFTPQPDTPLEEYLSESKTRAQQVVQEVGLFQPSHSNAPTSFAELFPDKQPSRPLQQTIDAIPNNILNKPCLAIIEAPTGEGKTEAALSLAHRLAHAHGTDEIYYALPTMATSNQMFKRLQAHLYERLHLPTFTKLVHGQAFLVEADLRIEPLDNGDPKEQNTALKWIGADKRKALLMPFGVGTIDQAELAALNVRFVALRLMGLAGKVVVMDEVHAYDTYMTTIIKRLLEWLSASGTSVILLSATLPLSRRKELLRAYGGEVNASDDEKTYPKLTVIGQASRHDALPQAAQPQRAIELDKTLHLADDDAESKARWLLEQAKRGHCVAWMTNTVARAQDIFKQVDALAPAAVERMLLHASLPLDERQKREDELTQKYGPDGQRPRHGGIVVGTQVLEQSLDLDFDVLATDLAPIDFLLQRAGRLHRHSRGERGMPRFWLNVMVSEAGELQLNDADTAIYDEFILRQTWQTLKDKDQLNLPNDYRPLIEAVYAAPEPAKDNPLWQAWDQLRAKQEKAKEEANQRLIPECTVDYSFTESLSEIRYEEDENRAAWIVTQTRLGEKSINIIPLEREGDQAWCITADGERIQANLQEAPSRELERKLLRRQVRISRRGAVAALEREQMQTSLPPLFADSLWLKEYQPLWLKNGQAHLPSSAPTAQLTLNPKLGLVIETKKDLL